MNRNLPLNRFLQTLDIVAREGKHLVYKCPGIIILTQFLQDFSRESRRSERSIVSDVTEAATQSHAKKTKKC